MTEGSREKAGPGGISDLPAGTEVVYGEVAPVDLLAIAAHPDDAELVCGGTLIRSASQGHRTAVLDLTRGEMGTRGSPQRRAEEARCAASKLGLTARVNAGLADGALANTPETRARVTGILRTLDPQVVILPFPRGRHPDHRVASELGREACFLAGLARYGESSEPHRPRKLLYALSFREDPVKPTFVVDIGSHFERKMEAIRCFASQFDGETAAGEAFPTGQPLYELVETQNRHYGSRIRKAYGEPFWTEETMAVEDVLALPVRSM